MALEALARADQVVMGPGSLFTSVLAAVAVPGLAEGIRTSPGRRVYVANLRPEGQETAGYDVADHVAALAAHGIEVDVVVADPASIALGDLDVAVVAGHAGQGERPGPRPGETGGRPRPVWSDRT